MNILMDWMKGKLMKYHISDKEYDMIQKDMQEENCLPVSILTPDAFGIITSRRRNGC